ncbi:thiamine pyrophosphate-binding protein [Enterococcus canintestini]|uniref:thiamine pyrophosphate-binding protein n=1 Tax=Enterococcus canintestini TaxID=317010 RepID=UPI00288D781A|nr:thiamine pyrophosphate-binding protein [Enterococcus canintestini]MDT2740343.1 thiamine pyrophosphate-binding protein [Enterococcus canintestini]
MQLGYTDEKNAQIVVALLKKHNIKKIVASPGATNIPFVQSVQHDPFFEVYSVVDERSAGYIACGLSEESGEPVVLSCTGATASRNYLSALTEAYYRKIPIIAITSFNGNYSIGNLVAQNIDRTVIQQDVAKISVQLPIVKDAEDFWYTNLLVNKAILESFRHGKGPVHINLPTNYLGSFTTKELPEVSTIRRYIADDNFPQIASESKIAIFFGAHHDLTSEEERIIDKFCENHRAVVLCDHTSGYYGKFGLQSALACSNGRKGKEIYESLKPDIIFHFGEISGDYSTLGYIEDLACPVWRISKDGELRDKFKRLQNVFECNIVTFFSKLDVVSHENDYYYLWENYDRELRMQIPELPFSNLWIAKELAQTWTSNTVIHLGILNSLRCNNFFPLKQGVRTYSNVGGFGIDGTLSSLIGASYSDSNKNYIGYLGDLAFFYDMNSLGLRDIGKNIKIIVINNNGGAEFKLYSHVGATLKDSADEFVAARNHYTNGQSSSEVVKKWSEAVGFQYFYSTSKENFKNEISDFLNFDDRPAVLECFTKIEDDSDAIRIIENIDQNFTSRDKMKNTLKTLLPNDLKKSVKKVLRKN